MRHFRVVLKAYCDCVIEAETEDEAMDIAIADVASGDYQFDEGMHEGVIPEDQIERAVSMCDFKSLAKRK